MVIISKYFSIDKGLFCNLATYFLEKTDKNDEIKFFEI